MTKEELERELKQVTNKANLKPGKLIRFMPGWYFVKLQNEIVEINQLDEGINKGQWIAREYNYKWHSDPMPTLRDLKINLGI